MGAGASNPYGYPTGQGLRKEICDRSVSDINRYFSSHVPPSKWPNDRKLWLSQQSNNAETFRNTFRDSSTKSIDLFLARNPDYMRIGKISIIFRILSAEGSRIKQHFFCKFFFALMQSHRSPRPYSSTFYLFPILHSIPLELH